MRDVAIVGVGMTKFGELWETSLRDLFVHAATDEEAGFAADILKLYEPLAVEVLEPARPRAI